MHCKDGKVLDIRESENMLYTLTNINSDNWKMIEGELPTDLNVQTFAFGEAIRNMKNGYKVARNGWNGKEMYVTLIPPGNAMFQGFPMQKCLAIKTADDKMQPGWLPSQADLLAEDWQIVG